MEEPATWRNLTPPPQNLSSPPSAIPKLIPENSRSKVQHSVPPLDPTGWGPVYDEDEDLRRAIQNSLLHREGENTALTARGGATTGHVTAPDNHMTFHGSIGRNKDVLVTGHHLSRSHRTSGGHHSNYSSMVSGSNYLDSTPLAGSDHTPIASNHQRTDQSHRDTSRATTSREQNGMELTGPFFQEGKDDDSLPSPIRQLFKNPDNPK